MVDRDSRPVTRRRIVKGLGVGAGAALAGCLGGDGGTPTQSGDGGSGGDGSSGDGGGSSGGDSSGEAPLFWLPAVMGDDNDPWRNYYKDQFKQEHGYSVEVAGFQYMDARQKFLTGARTGKPDAIEGLLSHRSEFVFADLLEPVDDRASDLDYFDGFFDSAVEAATVKGSLVGLPYTGNGRAMVYRKDIFEDLGLEPPETAEEFLEVGRAIKNSDHDVVPYHNCTKKGSVRSFQEWISHVYQMIDGNLYEFSDGGWTLTATAEDLGKVFDYFYYQVYAADDPIGDPDDLGTGWRVNDPGFLNGNYAMIPCGPWLMEWTTGDNIENTEETKTLLNEKAAVSQIPYISDGGSPGTFLEVKFVMMNKHSDNKDRAWEAMSYFASPDFLNNAPNFYNATPIHEDVESEIEDDDWSGFADAIKIGTSLAPIKWGEVRQAYYKHMQEVAWGRTDPYEAGENLHAALKDLESDVGSD